eukprot:7129861-Prymnesium_polylepis.1
MGPDQDPRDAKRVTGAENQLSNLARWTRANRAVGNYAVRNLRRSRRGPPKYGIYVTVAPAQGPKLKSPSTTLHPE